VAAYIARCTLAGHRRADFWRTLGFPNLVLAREARWKGHKLEQWKQAERERTPFAILDDVPAELRPRPRRK